MSQHHNEGTEYISDLSLDDKTIIKRNPQIEHEKAVAIFDLLQFNRFSLHDGETGPYKVILGTQDRNLTINVHNQELVLLRQFVLSMSPFKRLIKDYFSICESYFEAIKTLTPTQIETIDMARRGIHDDGALLLQERLQHKIICDKMTARRLFTLICVLHMGNIT